MAEIVSYWLLLFCFFNMSGAILKLLVSADDAASDAAPRAEGFFQNIVDVLAASGMWSASFVNCCCILVL